MASKVLVILLSIVMGSAVASDILTPVTGKEFAAISDLAKQSMKNAYIAGGRSAVKVGAVLKTTDGRVFTGSNIKLPCGQNLCAEMVALYGAINSTGGDFVIDTILVESDLEHGCPPCGVCRQAVSNFIHPKTKMVFRNKQNNLVMGFYEDLLPFPYEK